MNLIGKEVKKRRVGGAAEVERSETRRALQMRRSGGFRFTLPTLRFLSIKFIWMTY
jgi:hypothetical protein